MILENVYMFKDNKSIPVGVVGLTFTTREFLPSLLLGQFFRLRFQKLYTVFVVKYF